MTSFSAANPPSMKRLSSVGLNEPAQKRPPTPLEGKVVESEVRTRLGLSRRFRGKQELPCACVDNDFSF